MVAVVDKIITETGRIDVLVNNAGIGQASIRPDARRNPIRMWEITPEQWQRFLTVNATGPIMMARAVVPHMLAAGSGRVITVTTSLGTMVREYRTATTRLDPRGAGRLRPAEHQPGGHLRLGHGPPELYEQWVLRGSARHQRVAPDE